MVETVTLCYDEEKTVLSHTFKLLGQSPSILRAIITVDGTERKLTKDIEETFGEVKIKLVGLEEPNCVDNVNGAVKVDISVTTVTTTTNTIVWIIVIIVIAIIGYFLFMRK